MKVIIYSSPCRYSKNKPMRVSPKKLLPPFSSGTRRLRKRRPSRDRQRHAQPTKQHQPACTHIKRNHSTRTSTRIHRPKQRANGCRAPSHKTRSWVNATHDRSRAYLHKMSVPCLNPHLILQESELQRLQVLCVFRGNVSSILNQELAASG